MKNQPEPPPPPYAYPMPPWFPPPPPGPTYAEADARADAAALDLKCRIMASLTGALERAQGSGKPTEGIVEALVIVAGTPPRELRGTCYRWPKPETVEAEVVESK